MAQNSKIEWCDHTFNPWIGCTKVSAGCDFCYAEAMMDKRYGRVKWGPHGDRVRTSEGNWHQPIRWNGAARRRREAWDSSEFIGRSLERPRRPRVFCASLADVFDNQVPPEWRADLFQLIKATPELDWLLLTKRPENIWRMLPKSWLCPDWATFEDVPPSEFEWNNVWLGFTAEDQEHFDSRWAVMSQIPAVVRFCSYEPALGPLRLLGTGGLRGALHWLICGGESGPGHRPMDMNWELEIAADCHMLGIAYFLKQLSGKAPIPPNMHVVRQFPFRETQ